MGLLLVLVLIIKHDSDNKGNDKGQKVMQPTLLCITFSSEMVHTTLPNMQL